MRKKSKRAEARAAEGERGAVRILVLFVLAGLAVLTVEFSRDTLLDRALSTTSRSILASKLLLESGGQLAATVLVRNNQAALPDHPRKEWGRFAWLLQKLSAELRGSELSGSIEDENSFFPVNALFYERPSEKARAEQYAALFTRLLATVMVLHGFEGDMEAARQRAGDFMASLRQWGGAAPLDEESRRWYLAQKPVCLPPGRPPRSLDEFLLMRWPGLDQADAAGRAWIRQVLLGGAGLPGLLEHLTLWGRGPMNINTLRPAVLAALVEDPNQIKAFVSAITRYRDDSGNRLDEDWYDGIFSAHSVPMLPPDMLDTRSRWFRLHLTAGQGARKNRLTAVGWVTNTYMNWQYRVVE